MEIEEFFFDKFDVWQNFSQETDPLVSNMTYNRVCVSIDWTDVLNQIPVEEVNYEY